MINDMNLFFHVNGFPLQNNNNSNTVITKLPAGTTLNFNLYILVQAINIYGGVSYEYR